MSDFSLLEIAMSLEVSVGRLLKQAEVSHRIGKGRANNNNNDINEPIEPCFASVVYIEDITQWREDMNFMFELQEQYLMSERSERVRYCSCHENKKFISSEPTCNVLFVIWRNQFNKSKRRES